MATLVEFKEIEAFAKASGLAIDSLTEEAIEEFLNNLDEPAVEKYRKNKKIAVMMSAWESGEEWTFDSSNQTKDTKVDTKVDADAPVKKSVTANSEVTFAKAHVAPNIVTSAAKITAARKNGETVVVEVLLPNNEIQVLSFSEKYSKALIESKAELRFDGVVPVTNQYVYVQMEQRIAGRTTYLQHDTSIVAKAEKAEFPLITRRVKGVPMKHAICLHTADGNVFSGLLGTTLTEGEFKKQFEKHSLREDKLSDLLIESEVKARAEKMAASNQAELLAIEKANASAKADLELELLEQAERMAEKRNDKDFMKYYLMLKAK